MVKLYNNRGQEVDITLSAKKLRGLYEVLSGGKTDKDKEEVKRIISFLNSMDATGDIGETVQVSGITITYDMDLQNAYDKIFPKGQKNVQENIVKQNIDRLTAVMPDLAKEVARKRSLDEKKRKTLASKAQEVNKRTTLIDHLDIVLANARLDPHRQVGAGGILSPSFEFVGKMEKIRRKLDEPKADLDEIRDEIKKTFGKYTAKLHEFAPKARDETFNLEKMKVGIGRAVIEIEKLPKKEPGFLDKLKGVKTAISNALNYIRNLGKPDKKQAMIFSSLQDAKLSAIRAMSPEERAAKFEKEPKLFVELFNQSPERAILFFPYTHDKEARHHQVADFLIKNRDKIDPKQFEGFLAKAEGGLKNEIVKVLLKIDNLNNKDQVAERFKNDQKDFAVLFNLLPDKIYNILPIKKGESKNEKIVNFLFENSDHINQDKLKNFLERPDNKELHDMYVEKNIQKNIRSIMD